VARIVLTLPQPRAGALAALLRERGHEALECAFVQLQPLIGRADEIGLRERLAGADRLIFVSPTAVEVLADALDDDWPAGPIPAVVGPGSLAALAERRGVPAGGVLVPPGPAFDAAALLALPALRAPLGERILVVRAQGGNQMIETELRQRGAEVQAIEAYRRLPLDPCASMLARLAGWLAEGSAGLAHGSGAEATRLLVTTTDAATELARLADRDVRFSGLRQLQAIAIHPRIAARLRALGWNSVISADPGVESLLRALESGRDAAYPAGMRAAGTAVHRSGIESD
jgi:uroporphyrinogen-III synthase